MPGRISQLSWLFQIWLFRLSVCECLVDHTYIQTWRVPCSTCVRKHTHTYSPTESPYPEGCCGAQFHSKTFGKEGTWQFLLHGHMLSHCHVKLVLLVTFFIFYFFIHRILWQPRKVTGLLSPCCLWGSPGTGSLVTFVFSNPISPAPVFEADLLALKKLWQQAYCSANLAAQFQICPAHEKYIGNRCVRSSRPTAQLILLTLTKDFAHALSDELWETKSS